MNKFMHVSFVFAGIPKMRDLEPPIQLVSDDWIRYSATNWILWTARPSTEIVEILVRHIDAQDYVLAAPIALENCTGKLPPWVWVWINGKGKQVTGPFDPYQLRGLSNL
jgi:hypothetical protein